MEKTLQKAIQFRMAWSVTAAAAHDMNDELTIILGSIGAWLATTPEDNPDRDLLLAVRAAVQRCAWKTSTLLDACERRGVRPSATRMERLLLIS